MKSSPRRGAVVWILLAQLAAAPILTDHSAAGNPTAAAPAAPISALAGPHLSVTAHSIGIGGSALRYTATAGVEQIEDDGGKIQADMFFVAYVRQNVPEQGKRPITFVFNGGPGASSTVLHLDAVGPKRVRLADSGAPLPPPPEWVDNPSTWLGFTDLVFIDAVGTGFSSATPNVPSSTFYQVDGDARSFAKFIRFYLTANNREASPKFIAGESYGGTRAVILARLLERDFGITLNGIILISPVIDFETLNTQFRDPGRSTDLAYALDVPTYTATAWYHKKLGEALQANLQGVLREVEQWSITEYLPALIRGDALPEEAQGRIARALSQYTGVSEAVIRANHLRLLPSVFRRELLQDRQLQVSALDGRIVFDPRAASQFTTDAIVSPLGPVFDDYAKRELGYHTDLTYETLSSRVGREWDWGPGGATGFLSVTDDLRQAMRRNGALKVLIARGLYDLTVPYYGTDYALNQLQLGMVLRGNITSTYYASGHMVYTSQVELEKLTADVSAFVANALTAVHARP
jgi:carboxypeptidase C (cathepsin A)